MLTLAATEYHAKCLAAQALCEHPVVSLEQIHSWRHFFEKQIQSRFQEQLLAPLEEYLLWVEVLSADPDVPSVQVWPLAKIMAENERVRQLHCIPLAAIEAEGHAEHVLFLRVQTAFAKKLRQRKRLTFLEGLERLAQLPPLHSPVSSSRTRGSSLIQQDQGFEDIGLDPRVREDDTSLQKPQSLGAFSIDHYALFGFIDLPPLYQSLLAAPFTSPPVSYAPIAAQVLEATHPLAELKQALQCILNRPEKSFALVVNHAVLKGQAVQLILAEMELDQHIQYVSSMRPSLMDQPWFIFFKAWAQSFLSEDLEAFSQVLVSRYLGGDRFQNALWDVKLRERQDTHLMLAQFLQALPEEARAQSWWQQWQRMIHLCQKKQTIAEWLALLKTCEFQWPDGGEIWSLYLSKLQVLSASTVRYSWAEWLSILWEGAAGFYLAKPYYAKPRLHIVGFLEAVDLPVDAVWFLSADEAHLPLPANPLTFIPARLVPPEQPQRLLSRICANKEVYASWVKCEEVHLSPLFHQIASIPNPVEKIALSPGLEWVQDEVSLPLDPMQYQSIKGGSSLLEAQAKCPFKAFATYRLGIREWSAGRSLLDPMQKGSLIHRILECFWQQIKTQRDLLHCDLDAVLDPLIERELATPLLHFLEKDRLKARLVEWLNLEKQRPEFKVIAREESAVLSLSALLFNLRLDRVDALADGAKVVIDYKTGEVNPKDWFKDRLEAPQLPMYAILGQYTSVFYASLKAGKMGFFGEENLTAAQLQIWRDQLNTLALEFREGFAAVAPTPTACQYCHLAAVCRIQQTSV